MSDSTLRTEAQAWIAANGQPVVALVERAIRISEATGDRANANPFRRALIAEAQDR
jgi:hypothetical protein